MRSRLQRAKDRKLIRTPLRLAWKFRRGLFIFGLILFVINGINYLAPHALSPMAKAELDSPAAGPSAELSEHDQIAHYITEVFGSDAPKAFQLLRGNGKCSGENGNLDPNAVNDNTTWGGIGQDIGVFQISNKWQGVQDKFLKNWHINVQIAYQLFIENHKHFNLWTSGRCQGL